MRLRHGTCPSGGCNDHPAVSSCVKDVTEAMYSFLLIGPNFREEREPQMPLKTQQKPPQDETAVTRTCLGSELMIYLCEPPASRVEAQQSGARLLNAGQEQLLWRVGGRPQDLGLPPSVHNVKGGYGLHTGEG